MTIDELIELATEAREDLGGEAQRTTVTNSTGKPLASSPWTAAGSHARPSACTTTMARRRRSTPYCRYSGGMTSGSQAIADTSKSPLPGGLAFSGQPGDIYARTSAAYIRIKQKFDKTSKAAHFNHAMLLRLYDIAGIMHGT